MTKRAKICPGFDSSTGVEAGEKRVRLDRGSSQAAAGKLLVHQQAGFVG
jgi:hypothetical protein